MKHRTAILTCLCLLGAIGSGTAATITPAQMDWELPSKTSWETYRDHVRASSIFQLTRQSGRELLRFRGLPGFRVMGYVVARHKPGTFQPTLRGRLVSKNASVRAVFNVIGVHLIAEGCKGTSPEQKIVVPLNLPVLPDGRMASVPIPVDLPAELRCQRCGRVMNVSAIYIYLELVPLQENAPLTEPMEMEIAAIELPGDRQYMMQSTSSSPIRKLLQKENQQRAAWWQRHRALLNRYPANNRFNAARNTGLPTAAAAPDREEPYRYFSAAELIKLNPQWKIRKLASWPFFRSDVFLNEVYLPYGLPEVTQSCIRNGNSYAAGTGFLARFDREQKRWVYLTDDTVYKKHHEPPRTFPDDHGVWILRNQAFRLSDGSSLPLPGGVVGNEFALWDDQAVWIVENSKKLLIGRPDFSEGKELTFTPPPELAGTEFVQFEKVFATGPGRLLIHGWVRQAHQNLDAWMELDTATGKCIMKLPLGLPHHSVTHRRGGWFFQYRDIPLLDVGPGRELVALKGTDHLPPLDRIFQKLTRPLTETQLRLLNQAELVGPYLFCRTNACDRALLFRLDKPEESLMLYGFDFRHAERTADGGGLLLTMPDGLYEVRPAVMPELAITPTVNPRLAAKRPLPLEEVITEIAPDEPALFDAVLERDVPEPRLKFIVKPHNGAAKIRLSVKLPPPESFHREYLFFFEQDGKPLKERKVEIQVRDANGKGMGNVTDPGTGVRIISPKTAEILITAYDTDQETHFELRKITRKIP